MALWASAICVCWMHIWGIKVRQKYISVWYRHGIWFFNVDCTLNLSLLLRQVPELLCLYMKYVCIWVYTCIYCITSWGYSCYIYIYIYIYICIYRWAGAFAVEMRLSCTNPRKPISVYRTCLCAAWCGRSVDLLLARWGFPHTSPSMWSNIRTEDDHSTHNPAFCHVYVTHTSGVKNKHQCPVRGCGVSTRANICLHGEPTAPY